MNQLDLEKLMMSQSELALVTGIRAMIKNELTSQDLDIDSKASDAVDEAMGDIMSEMEDKIQAEVNDIDFESRVEEAIDNADIRDQATDAVDSALERYEFRDVVEAALIDLINNKTLDRSIWLPYRRPSWWRRLFNRLRNRRMG